MSICLPQQCLALVYGLPPPGDPLFRESPRPIDTQMLLHTPPSQGGEMDTPNTTFNAAPPQQEGLRTWEGLYSDTWKSGHC